MGQSGGWETVALHTSGNHTFPAEPGQMGRRLSGCGYAREAFSVAEASAPSISRLAPALSGSSGRRAGPPV